MAMDGNALGTKIAELIISKDAPSDMKAQVRQLWGKIGLAIVEHIKENAEVTVAEGIKLQAGGNSGMTVETGKGTIE